MDNDNYRFIRSSKSAFSIACLIVLVAALISIFIQYNARSVSEAPRVRVQNDSGLPLKNIRLNDVPFGDLSVGGISQYEPLAIAYPYASLRLEVANKEFVWMPIDHYGEKPLSQGNFTYSIRRENTPVGLEFVAQIRGSSTQESAHE